jgi:RNA-directed DNA polymerase
MNRERTAMLEPNEDQTTSAEGSLPLMEAALAPENREAALRAVERNGGAPGPDGMRTRDLRGHLAEHGEAIKRRLREGSYKPGAAKRRDIPKASGGTRPLSIPNVQDRFIQQLLPGVLQPVFEPRFSESSHG